MIGLLKSVNVRSGIKQPTPDSDLLHAQETSNIEGGLDTRSVVSEVCKQNCRQQHIGLDYHEDAGSILGRKKCSKEACGSPPTKRFCDLTDAAPRKRLRIVSDSSCRHQFEPLFSKCNLLNEYRNRSPSSFFGKSSSSGEIPQASLQCPLGTPTRHTSQQHKDSFCDKAFYKASYKCSHCSKENNVVVETHICPVKLQESASSESATLSQLLNNNGKQFDLKARRTRPNVASTVCNTFDAISNRESYGKINFSVKGEPIKPKEEKGCERQKSMYSDSEKDFVNHSFHSQNSNHYHVNKFRSDNLAILKAFVSNEKKGRLNLATKQLYMPSSEKPHGLKFTPRQHFDIISEDLPADETKQFVSEFGGKKNHAKTGIRSVITKENFVKELKNIFSRLPSLKEERLKEKGVYEMILMGKAYCDKFEFESREKQDRENNPLSNWRSARLSNNGSPALEQRTLDTVSNDHSPSCQLTVEPAKAVCAHDVPSVDRGKNSVISDEVIENGCKSINASSVLQSQANKTKSKTIWTPKELTTNVNKGAFRDNKTADCSDITLNSNFKSSRKQRKLAGHSKKSYPMKESNTHEACSICSKCDDHATNTLGTVFSTSKDISSADQTSVTEASIKKHSISAKEAFLTEGISETRKGINIESYRFDDQSGEEKTHGKIESCKFLTEFL